MCRLSVKGFTMTALAQSSRSWSPFGCHGAAVDPLQNKSIKVCQLTPHTKFRRLCASAWRKGAKIKVGSQKTIPPTRRLFGVLAAFILPVGKLFRFLWIIDYVFDESISFRLIYPNSRNLLFCSSNHSNHCLFSSMN